MATLILTAVGTAIGGPIGGAIGAILGQRADQAIFAPKGRTGPRLGDLSVQTSSYGSALPKLFGTMRVAGTVIWATDLREEKNRSGGGKGRPKTTTYSYSASFAVALSARQIRGVRRIWADGNLLRGAGGDFKTEAGAFRLHLGDEDQAADPLIAAAEGIDGTPAYRGCAYAVFEDLQLADYGNRIPSLTFEVEADAGPVGLGAIAAALSGGAVSGDGLLMLGGYAASGDSVRGAIEALADAAGAMVRDDGAGLVLAGSGAAEVVIARDQWLPGAESARAAALTIPDAVGVAYYEPARDYQTGVQRATRGGPGRRAAQIELPVAIDAGAAKAIAEARLARDWTARERWKIGLPWRWIGLRPGATVALEDVAGLWRVSESALEGMALKLSLVRVRGSGMGEMLGAEPGRAVHPPDAPHGRTIVHLLDLPDLGETPATAPRLHVAAAGEAAGWRRAALMLSLDDGASWSEAGGTAAPAVIGSALGVLDAGSSLMFDAIASVEIGLVHDGMALEEADDLRLIAGANLALLGDELIQFGRAEALGGGHYRLSRLLRGRRGTEDAIAGHQAGERFVLIEADTLAPIDLPIASIGGTARIMAMGIADNVPALSDVTGIGRSVRPPAPTGVTLSPRDDGGFTIGWIRRSRLGWRWIDGIDAPLGEERESYRLTIARAGGNVRVAESATPGFDYDAAMIAADGGTGSGLAISVVQTGSLAPSLAASALFAMA